MYVHTSSLIDHTKIDKIICTNALQIKYYLPGAFVIFDCVLESDLPEIHSLKIAADFPPNHL